jgi:NAD(P)-dependent dehydrogenase (short-subunit alcohol dehydrogenase family)
LALQGDGYTVIVAGRRQEPLDVTVSMASSSGGPMTAIVTDVSLPAGVDALFGSIRRDFKRLDVLFNNAGHHQRESYRGFPLRTSGVSPDEGPEAEGRSHHKQWIHCSSGAPAKPRSVHFHQACNNRNDEVLLA